jgi:hypothetical protein
MVDTEQHIFNKGDRVLLNLAKTQQRRTLIENKTTAPGKNERLKTVTKVVRQGV